MNEVSRYLRKLPLDERKVLTSIRTEILRLMPEADERLSRGVPFFYYKGKRAVGFRASRKHLSFFIMEGEVLHNHNLELSAYDSSSTVIRFTVQNPISGRLLEQLILARMTEIDARVNRK